MKRLWAMSFSLCLLASFLIAPISAFAQGIDRQTEAARIQNSQGTYDYFQGIVTSYFSSANTALDGVATRDEAQREPTARFKTYLERISEAYTSTFNQEKAKGTAPVDAQIAAIIAFNNAKQSGDNLALIANYSASAPQRTAISQLSTKMSDAARSAEQIKRGVITAGGAEDTALTSGAGTITNATGGNTNTTVKTSADPGQCSFVGGNLLKCVDPILAWIIKNTILSFAGFFLWLATNLLDYIISIGILNFKTWAPDGLYNLWLLVRQIVSMFIVFSGLYLGFMYIINKGDTFVKRFFPWLIAFGLFVNFSYPITRAIIDVSNIVSLNIYASAVGTDVLIGASKNSAGTVLMSRLGLKSLVDSATSVSKGNEVVDQINTTPAALLVVAYVFYAAYIFFMAAGILMLRTLALSFVIVASPLLLVDMVIPKLGDAAQKLRGIFVSQIAVSVVFMIMLYLSIAMTAVFGTLGGSAFGSTSNLSNVTQIFNVLMMLILLHIMLKVTKQVAGAVGEIATKGMGKVGGFALGAASMGTGVLARASIGRAAAAARDSSWVRNNQDRMSGRIAKRFTGAFADSSFNAQNSSLISGVLNKGGISLGKGRETNYQKDLAAKIADRQERFEGIQQTYAEDIRDKQGNILHRKGDVNEEGKLAANRFAQRAGGVIFNKGAVIKGVLEKQEAKNKQEEDAVKQQAQEYTQSYQGADKKFKEAALNNLKSQLAATEATDPNQEGEKARSLAKAIRDIEASKKKEKEDFDKQVMRAFNEHAATDEKRQAAFLARQTEEVQQAVKAKIDANKVGASSNDLDFDKNVDYAELVKAQAQGKVVFDKNKDYVEEVRKAA